MSQGALKILLKALRDLTRSATLPHTPTREGFGKTQSEIDAHAQVNIHRDKSHSALMKFQNLGQVF